MLAVSFLFPHKTHPYTRIHRDTPNGKGKLRMLVETIALFRIFHSTAIRILKLLILSSSSEFFQATLCKKYNRKKGKLRLNLDTIASDSICSGKLFLEHATDSTNNEKNERPRIQCRFVITSTKHPAINVAKYSRV